MPRKKVEAGVQTVSVVPIVTCPACKSSISSDGKALHKRSEFLDELIETDSAVDELEKEVEVKLCAKDTAIADLRAQLKAEQEKSARGNKSNVNVEPQEGATAATVTGKSAVDWYD